MSCTCTTTKSGDQRDNDWFIEGYVMATSGKDRMKELEETVAGLKSDRRGLRTSLTNLQKRTGILLDYLERSVEPKLQTKGLSQFRKQIRQVRRLL